MVRNYLQTSIGAWVQEVSFCYVPILNQPWTETPYNNTHIIAKQGVASAIPCFILFTVKVTVTVTVTVTVALDFPRTNIVTILRIVLVTVRGFSVQIGG